MSFAGEFKEPGNDGLLVALQQLRQSFSRQSGVESGVPRKLTMVHQREGELGVVFGEPFALDELARCLRDADATVPHLLTDAPDRLFDLFFLNAGVEQEEEIDVGV